MILTISVVWWLGCLDRKVETIWRFISHAWHAVEVKADAVTDADHGLADLVRIGSQQQPLEVDYARQFECEADAGDGAVSESMLNPSSSGLVGTNRLMV